MRLERDRGARRERWEAEIINTSIRIRTGDVGDPQLREKLKHYGTAQQAANALEALVAEKRKAGFGEPIILGANYLRDPQPTNPTLEQAARDDGTLAVYADWLQARGAPVGEYIAVAAALERGSDAQQWMRFGELTNVLGLPTPFATWATKHGFFAWLRFHNTANSLDDSFDAPALARRLFATPLCAALDELRIGDLRWRHNHQDVPAVIEAAHGFTWARSLARLHLGDVDDRVDLDHHHVGNIGRSISRTFPQLRWLKVRSGGAQLVFDGLALPALETLVIETCGMTRDRLAELLHAELPALTRLVLWFGASDRGCATLDDLAPLLDGTVFPNVTHLGLANLDFSGELVARLGTIAPRLVELDLSMGSLGDEDVPALRALPIAKIDVDDNFLSDDALAALGDRFTSRAQPKHGGDHRYASICE